MIDIERLLRVPYVDVESGFDISPDETCIAFAWNVTGVWEIYKLELGASDDPKPCRSSCWLPFSPPLLYCQRALQDRCACLAGERTSTIEGELS
jgi:hypothetical protein